MIQIFLKIWIVWIPFNLFELFEWFKYFWRFEFFESHSPGGFVCVVLYVSPSFGPFGLPESRSWGSVGNPFRPSWISCEASGLPGLLLGWPPLGPWIFPWAFASRRLCLGKFVWVMFRSRCDNQMEMGYEEKTVWDLVCCSSQGPPSRPLNFGMSVTQSRRSVLRRRNKGPH